MKIQDHKDFFCNGFQNIEDHPAIFLSAKIGETVKCPYCNRSFEYTNNSK